MPLPSEIIANKFPFTPTSGQARLFKEMNWLLDISNDQSSLLIKGYAGTGKTTVVSALVNVLPTFNYRYVLLAPTGRAAKVMTSYSKKTAYTIHKRIYKKSSEEGAELAFKRQKNYAKKTIFIVDEASMIHEDRSFGSNGLLSDLLGYVFSDKSNRLILIGDDAQLPPVGQDLSPALNQDYLEGTFHTAVREVVLTEVMRQEQGSGILVNATALRTELSKKDINPRLATKGHKDVFQMTGERMEDGIRYAYDTFGVENAIIICRSNKAANSYNQYIRTRINFSESELDAGEILMIVRNNYLHVPDGAGEFIANGDFVEVMKIVSFEEMYGFRFATLQLRLLDYPMESAFEAKVMLDTLYSEAPALTSEQNNQLYTEVRVDYADLSSKKELREALKQDPYLNALQVKFAYAMTCHKAQGGQWDAVFVDQGYLRDDSIDKDYIRWLYTAVTRATNQLFFVNFNKKRFFS